MRFYFWLAVFAIAASLFCMFQAGRVIGALQIMRAVSGGGASDGVRH